MAVSSLLTGFVICGSFVQIVLLFFFKSICRETSSTYYFFFSPKNYPFIEMNNVLIFRQLISVSEYLFILGMSYQINCIFMLIIVIHYVFMFMHLLFL